MSVGLSEAGYEDLYLIFKPQLLTTTQRCVNKIVIYNITIHLISYSLRLPLPGDCGRWHLDQIRGDGEDLHLLHIFVDADACPVKQEVYRVANRYRLDVTLVANSWMRVPNERWITLEVVEDGFDAVNSTSKSTKIPESVPKYGVAVHLTSVIFEMCNR